MRRAFTVQRLYLPFPLDTLFFVSKVGLFWRHRTAQSRNRVSYHSTFFFLFIWYLYKTMTVTFLLGMVIQSPASSNNQTRLQWVSKSSLHHTRFTRRPFLDKIVTHQRYYYVVNNLVCKRLYFVYLSGLIVTCLLLIAGTFKIELY